MFEIDVSPHTLTSAYGEFLFIKFQLLDAAVCTCVYIQIFFVHNVGEPVPPIVLALLRDIETST